MSQGAVTFLYTGDANSVQKNTAVKSMKFYTKPILHYPPHLRHVAILPWENSNFLSINWLRFGKVITKVRQHPFLRHSVQISHRNHARRQQ